MRIKTPAPRRDALSSERRQPCDAPVRLDGADGGARPAPAGGGGPVPRRAGELRTTR